MGALFKAPPSRHFAVARQFGRFWTEADIGPIFMSWGRPSKVARMSQRVRPEVAGPMTGSATCGVFAEAEPRFRFRSIRATLAKPGCGHEPRIRSKHAAETHPSMCNRRLVDGTGFCPEFVFERSCQSGKTTADPRRDREAKSCRSRHNAAIQKIPDKKSSVDPWGNVRPSSPSASKNKQQ